MKMCYLLFFHWSLLLQLHCTMQLVCRALLLSAEQLISWALHWIVNRIPTWQTDPLIGGFTWGDHTSVRVTKMTGGQCPIRRKPGTWPSLGCVSCQGSGSRYQTAINHSQASFPSVFIFSNAIFKVQWPIWTRHVSLYAVSGVSIWKKKFLLHFGNITVRS